MSAVGIAHLDRLYANSPDPWNFRTSTYERDRFAATLAALQQPRYRSILEIGCGNGELARRLARLTDRYVGFDAVERALAEARAAVPAGTFYCDFFPCRLPTGEFDLIVVSEFLYFLDREGVEDLAVQIRTGWPDAEVLCVNYRGPTGNSLQGDEAVELFGRALGDAYRVSRRDPSPAYRIDRFIPAAGETA